MRSHPPDESKLPHPHPTLIDEPREAAPGTEYTSRARSRSVEANAAKKFGE